MWPALRLWRQAVGDLAARYRGIFRHARRESAKFDPRPRPAHEAQFLPAVLELQETPVSPAPRLIMWLLMAFALIALLWAVFGRLDVVAVAPGKIVPSDRTKVIQPIETATVKAIRVTDGQAVRAGEVLIELDTTQADADAARLANDLLKARLQAARAQALLAAITGGQPPTLERFADVPAERLRQEQRLLDGQHEEFRAQLASFDSDIARRGAELRSTGQIVHKLELTAPLARQRAADFKNLVDRHFVSQHSYLDREQVRIEQEADLATARSRIAELTAAVQGARDQRAALVAQTRRQALDSLDEAEQKATTYRQELVKADARRRLMTLMAPVDGTVQQLAVHTVGGVVTPAQPLMMLVPKDNPVEVEAYVENKDIGFVSPGQAAMVKVETFPFTKYGIIKARVVSVSDDAANDEQRGLIFPARVALAQATIRVEKKTVALSPGMAVTVEVKTAKRRVIEYFLSPLLQYQNESLRER